MEQTLINGESYAWRSVKTIIMGRLITSITAIDYKDAQDIEPNYGAGEKPIGVGYGQIKYTGSITLYKELIEDLKAIAPNGRLQEIPPFTITVSFTSNGRTKTEKLLSCIFMDNAVDVKAGDKSIPVKIPLFIGDIKWK
jgi:hypothetical protein